jgi:Spy/CpxP family protein refolding chaperone
MKTHNKTLVALAALAAFAALGAAETAWSQTTGNTWDDTQLLISQIQTDKRALMLKSLDLTDAETAKFTPIYDQYQKERKELAERTVDLLNKYSSNYDSMTDAAAKGILKDWFKLKDDENDLVKKYAKRVANVLPETKALRFVQIENKLNTVMAIQAVRGVPLAK